MMDEKIKMADVARIITRPQDRLEGDDPPPRREWLVTNGLGGYASGTVAGVINRRYQGLLVASLPAPLGRLVMLNHLLERVRLHNGQVAWLFASYNTVGQDHSTGVVSLLAWAICHEQAGSRVNL